MDRGRLLLWSDAGVDPHRPAASHRQREIRCPDPAALPRGAPRRVEWPTARSAASSGLHRHHRLLLHLLHRRPVRRCRQGVARSVRLGAVDRHPDRDGGHRPLHPDGRLPGGGVDRFHPGLADADHPGSATAGRHQRAGWIWRRLGASRCHRSRAADAVGRAIGDGAVVWHHQRLCHRHRIPGATTPGGSLHEPEIAR